MWLRVSAWPVQYPGCLPEEYSISPDEKRFTGEFPKLYSTAIGFRFQAKPTPETHKDALPAGKTGGKGRTFNAAGKARHKHKIQHKGCADCGCQHQQSHLCATRRTQQCGVLFAKLLNLFQPEGKKLNPVIDAAGLLPKPGA